MKRLIAAGLACGLLAGAAGGLAAKDHGPGGGWREAVKAKLGITDEQAAKLKAARRAHRDAVTPLRDKLEDEMETLRGLVKQEGKDKEIEASLARLKDLHKALQAQRERLMDASAAVLTPSQRAKVLLGMAGRMRGRMMMRSHHRGGPGTHGPMGPHGGPGLRGPRGWGGGGWKDAPADLDDGDEVELEVEEGPEED